MTVLADFPLDSNVIVVLVAVIFAAIKAFLERGHPEEAGREDELEEDELVQQYETEIRRQREQEEARRAREAAVPGPARPHPPIPNDEAVPPPLPGSVTPDITHREAALPVRPKLSAAEKEALKNLKLKSPQSHRNRGASRSTKSRIYRHLSSPTAAREALVLAEVLGPPRAFKSER